MTESLKDIILNEEASDLYELLGLEKSATQSDIKKAYYRLALKHHPDRHANATQEQQKEESRKFQALSFAYHVLNTPAKREKYDRTGETSDDLFEINEGGVKYGWDAYFKDLWDDNVNAESIEAFRDKYQNSAEERKDLLDSYEKHEGDMDRIMADIPCSTANDEERFCKIIKEAIDADQICLYKKFTATSSKAATARRRKAAEREAKEAEEMARKLGLNDKLYKNNNSSIINNEINDHNSNSSEDALKQIIKKRAQKRTSEFLENMEKKYGAGSSNNSNNIGNNSGNNRSKKRKTGAKKSKEEKHGDDWVVDDDYGEEVTNDYKEPTEEEFLAIRERITAGKKKGKKQGK
ncbi:12054_t:CDS:2 [Ambispora leptoticha]|uniref:12054_t:CDS:1 n=1 Tax=Ambispora leptoticha TaxID=144679 RepID=A0A9N8Z679_9GLOM|nr:12054_t:CDS:2 [Ambispora leptoticha]